MSVLDQAFFKAYGLVEEPVEPEDSAVADTGQPIAPALAEATHSFPRAPTQPLPYKDSGAETARPNGETHEPASQRDASVPGDSGDARAGEVSAVEEANSALVCSAADTRTPTEPPAYPANAPSDSLPGTPQSSEGFCPQLQVDRYFWPAEVIRLCQAAEGPLDAVIDTLALEAARGKNVVGVGHCRSGDGATTLLLCLARRLAQHGVKVALVDADLRRPRLARRLGVLAESGWDDACTGRLSLSEVVVESLHDRLALVPRADTTSAGLAEDGGSAKATHKLSSPSEALSPAPLVAQLRRHYDVVLVDLGHCGDLLATHAAADGPPWVDQVIVVRNARRPSPGDFAAAVRQLRSLGIEAAVVDNFV